eukprot:TRINITY_DN1252_c0_g1_i1.p1 TRINITY_DN1252_c0_g1~~TRINITY_DN1252_c0_g1_i1.p1  ORF type:complete len:557 (+),score=67.67 TRINITY_DN1252_c0_g1_i1:1875-3545(+)
MLRDNRSSSANLWQAGAVKSNNRNLYCLVSIVLLVQAGLLVFWSNLHQSRYLDGGALSGDAGASNLANFVEQVRSDVKDAFREQEQKILEIGANLNSQLKEYDSQLVGLSIRMQEREKDLGKWQDKMAEIRTMLQNQVAIPRGGKLAAADAQTDLDNNALADEAKGPPVKCHRMQDVGKNGRIIWSPTPNKYMLVMCTGGQFSNRLACIRQHILDAALLNRTLILPSKGIDYDYDSLLDLKQPKVCFGNTTFLTLDQYLKQLPGRGKTLRVDRFICHVHTYQKPSACDGLRQQYSRLPITFTTTDIPPLRTSGPWFKYSSKDFLAKFAYKDDVIAFGNMFGVGGKDLRFEGSGPIKVAEECRYYLTPSPPILEAAQGFVNSYLGSRYLAVHLRRGDFFQHCMMSGQVRGQHAGHACFQPLQQVASCLAKRIALNPGVRSVYLATNGNDQEVALLVQYLQFYKVLQPVVRLHDEALQTAPWAEVLRRRGLETNPAVVALVEKSICVLSSAFYGTPGSTFSGDITRLRDWWYTRTCKDGSLCDVSEVVDAIPVVVMKR